MASSLKNAVMSFSHIFTPIKPTRLIALLCVALVSLAFLYFCTRSGDSSSRSERRFRFIFCNDVHYRGAVDSAMLKKVFDEWDNPNTIGVGGWEFAVLAGDLTDNGTVDELASLKKQLDKGIRKPYYPLIGNHDITGPGDEGKQNFASVFGEAREDHFFIHKNVGMLFLDLSNGPKAQVTVKVSTKLWLKKTLSRIPRSMPLLVFTHFPMHPDSPRFAVDNSVELFRMLDDYNVLAYFSGHFHGYWCGYRHGIPFFTNFRLLHNYDPTNNYPGSSYLVVDVYKSGVGVSLKPTM